MNPIKYMNSYLKIISNDYLDGAFYFFVLFLVICFFLPYWGVVSEVQLQAIYALVTPLFNFADVLNVEKITLGITWLILLVALAGSYKIYKDEKVAIVFKADHIKDLKRFESFKEKIPGIFYALIINAFGIAWIYFFNKNIPMINEIATHMLSMFDVDATDWLGFVGFIFVFAGAPFCLPFFLACGIGALIAFFTGLPWLVLGSIIFIPFIILYNEFSIVKMVVKEIEDKILEATK